MCRNRRNRFCLCTFLASVTSVNYARALRCVRRLSSAVSVCSGSQASHNSPAKARLVRSGRWSLDQKTSRQISAWLQRSERRRKSLAVIVINIISTLRMRIWRKPDPYPADIDTATVGHIARFIKKNLGDSHWVASLDWNHRGWLMDPHRGLSPRGDRSLCPILELGKSYHRQWFASRNTNRG